jgi:NAD(P)H dehydrogenase (quinone)
MRVSVILGHPRPGSFNHALADAACASLRANGHEVAFHDLYQEGFDPVVRAAEIPRSAPLDPVIRRHCDEIAAADGIVVVHPNWWGQPPAILKGWVDRVLRPDVAYRFAEGDNGEGVPVGLLAARVALVLNTSNTPLAREMRDFGDPLQLIWKNCTFDLCGVPRFDRRTFAVLITSTPEQRAAWVAEARALVERHFPREG